MLARVSASRRFAGAALIGACALLPSAPSQAQQTAPPAAQTKTAAVPAPENAGAQAGKKPAPAPKSLATWRGKVIEHLNSRKSATIAGDGTATVAFKIDRTGKVMSSQLLTSSGNKALDAEAVALTQRASPVPAPPADVTGATLYLKVPIRFKR